MDVPIDDAILRSLAVSSMATLLLVQDTAMPPCASRPDIAHVGNSVTPSLDGAVDLRTAFLRDSVGIRVMSDQGTSITRTMPFDQLLALDVSEIPHLLKQQTKLAVEILAKCCGVSKVTYHKWLNGAGISEEFRDRLVELHDTLQTLTEVRPDLRHFLDMHTAAGTPLELLADRQDAFVVGLAIRGDQGFQYLEAREPLEHLGLHRPRRIGWAHPVDSDQLEDFSPRTRGEEKIERDPEGDPRNVSFVLAET